MGGRMRTSALLSVCALAMLTLAGCSGSDAPGDAELDEDEPSKETVDVGNGTKVAVNRGAVEGRVINDAGQAVPKARVSLVGTQFFKNTPEDGTFRFVNVTLGQHTLRTEASGFRVSEKTVNVTGGQLTEVQVILIPDQDVGAGYRPHSHNYWRGADSVTVLDADIETRTPPTEDPYGSALQTFLYPNRQSHRWAVTLPDELESGEAALIYPGTQRIEVTVSWDDGASNLEQIQFGYRAPGEDEVRLDPADNGGTWTIAVAPGTTDNGHQAFTLWEFWLSSPNEPTDPQNLQPAFMLGPVHVKMEVFRGEIPLEPEHPDFWKNGDRLVLAPGSEPYEFNIAVTAQERSPHAGANGAMALESGTIVPPGTTRMRVDFHWVYDSPVNGTYGQVDDWDLAFRTADQHPQRTSAEEFRRFDPVEGDAACQCKVYEFDVEDAWTDAFYQQASLWRFWLERDPEPTTQDYRATGSEFYLKVTVWRGA